MGIVLLVQELVVLRVVDRCAEEEHIVLNMAIAAVIVITVVWDVRRTMACAIKSSSSIDQTEILCFLFVLSFDFFSVFICFTRLIKI